MWSMTCVCTGELTLLNLSDAITLMYSIVQMKPFCCVSGADTVKGQREPHRIHRLVLDSRAWQKARVEAWHLKWELPQVAH